MSIIATPGESKIKDVELIPEGSHIARVYQIIHIGTIDVEYREDGVNKNKKLNKVRIGFEFPTEMRVFSDDKGEQPSVIQRNFTISTHEKSALRPFIESLQGGKKLTVNEEANFEVEGLMGKACIVTVVHNVSPKNKRVYANISGSAPIMKGMEVPKEINKPFIFSFHPFDPEKFKLLPDFITDQIKGSLEYMELFEDHSSPEPSEGEVNIDDIPF